MRATNQIVPSPRTKTKKGTRGGARRKHRRVRTDWSGCRCPEGAEHRSTPRITRGWTCLKLTARGPRFVRAVCDSASARSLPSPREHKRLPSSTQKLLRADNQLFGYKPRTLNEDKASSSASKKKPHAEAGSSKKKRTGALSGAACGCPEGANRVKTKNGSRCHKNGKFVKTVCVTGD